MGIKTDPDRTWVEPLIARLPASEPGSFDRMLRQLAKSRARDVSDVSEREYDAAFDEAQTVRLNDAVAAWRAARATKRSAARRWYVRVMTSPSSLWRQIERRVDRRLTLVLLMAASALVGLLVGRTMFSTPRTYPAAEVRSRVSDDGRPSAHPSRVTAPPEAINRVRPMTHAGVAAVKREQGAGEGNASDRVPAASRDVAPLVQRASIALFSGRLLESAELYSEAAKRAPHDSTLATVAHLLRRRAARMCENRPQHIGLGQLCGDN